MIIRIIRRLFDVTVGTQPVRRMMLSLVGYRWNGWLLGIVGYRAIHMVSAGECCILAGIFSAKTVENFSRAVGEKGTVVVVEASPEIVARLGSELAHLTNVKIINRAVWREKGEVEFLVAGQNRPQGYNRIKSGELQEFPYHMVDRPATIKVMTTTLDDIATHFELSVVHHINLTINGAELQALEGMKSIRKHNPAVRIYINSELPDPALKTIESLKNLGFCVYTSRWIRTVNKRIKLLRIYAIAFG